IPAEFLCPLSGVVMADPVIVLSGHTFERSVVDACVSLSFIPLLPDGAVPDFSAVIPNLALRSAISSWCRRNYVDPPGTPLDFDAAVGIVRQVLDEMSQELPRRTVTTLSSSTSSSSSSSCSSGDGQISSSDSLPTEERSLVAGLKRNLSIEKQEEALIALRVLTRTREEIRAAVCTSRLLSAVKALIASKHPSLQINATAVAANLSLEGANKAKIVRSGLVHPLVDALENGAPESRDNAACALFGLSMDDHNKGALGALGALGPLLRALRSDSPATRRDSALALYHLSAAEGNRVKLIRLGAGRALLGMIRSGRSASFALLVLCNLACSPIGRAAMLDAGAVDCFVGMLSSSSSAARNCLSALYGLSYGGRRFNALAKAAAAEDAISKLKIDGDDERGKQMVKRILTVLK
ncbi:hypothetical protein M569_14902, partial [Genlisea aurea]